MRLNKVCDGLIFPEGPVWMPDGSVLVTEIIGGTVKRCYPDGHTETVAIMGGGPNGAAIGPDGALYVCNNGGMEHTKVPSRGWILPGEQPHGYRGGSIQRLNLQTGAVTTLYAECDGRRLTGPNDIVFDSAGGFWFTDHGKLRPRDRDRGGVYYATPDGKSIKEVLFPLDAPNGIALSPDGSRLYVAESFTARLWAWEVLGPGELRVKPRARVLGGDLLCGLGGYHLFDSMAVDPAGNVCVATVGGHTGITVVSPAAKTSHLIALPGPMPTNICFGGASLEQAFATLSPQGELVSWTWSPVISPSW